MSKYIITVTEQVAHPSGNPTTTEVFKYGVDDFDVLTFVQALTAKPRGRPSKAKKEVAS